MSLRTRTKVLCFCKKCNGSLVDPRTKSKHMSIYTHKENNPDNNYQDAGPSNVEPTTAYDNNEMDLDPLTDITDLLPDESIYHFLTKKISEKSQRGKKGKISNIVLDNILSFTLLGLCGFSWTDIFTCRTILVYLIMLILVALISIGCRSSPND